LRGATLHDQGRALQGVRGGSRRSHAQGREAARPAHRADVAGDSLLEGGAGAMPVVYRPGTWTDVCVLPDGRFVQVTTDGAIVRWFVEDASAPLTHTAPEALMFARAAAVGFNVYSIHQGNATGKAWLDAPIGFKDLGPTFGVQPVAIDGTYAYVVRSNQTYDRIALATGEVEHLPHGAPGSSQGISDVSSGHVFWSDEDSRATIGGIAMHEIARLGSLAVGQADPSQIAGWNFATMQPFTAIEGIAYEPHIAQSGDRYAICARTPHGAAFIVVPPFPAFVSAAVPVPQPTPKPEPKPVPVQNRAPQLAAFHQQYNGGQPITDDAEKHRFTAALASFLNKQDGDTRWGRKARPGTDAVSKDTLGYWLGPLVPHNPTDGKVDAFDLIASSGAVSWDLRAEQNDPGYRSIDARWFPVAAVPDPGTTPPNPGTPAPVDYERRLKAVEDAVAAIEAASAAERVAVAQLGEALKMLSERPAPTYRVSGTTSRDYGHSHRINVTLVPA